MAEASGPRADFGTRFVAALIDGVILAVVQGVLGLALGDAGRLLSIVVTVGYYGLFEGSDAGQTIGKAIMKIRVVRFDGGTLGQPSALLRAVSRYVSALPCLLGYLWALWDDEKQTWHDKIAGSVVVPVADYPVPPAAA